MEQKRLILFDGKKAEEKGFDLLHDARMSFSYRGDGQYVITKKQCAILKAKEVKYKIKKYL